ncbi:MAG: carotene hydroxylase [Cytophagaceae bacterium]|nr:MAG: carotene hydroxylase [Cytophagaceae bacterium]
MNVAVWGFAIPSFFAILFGHQLGYPLVAVAGYGIMAYGFVYFLVHESIIHRRFRFIRGRSVYFRALIVAHTQHHINRGKLDSINFGMLFVHPKYFRDSFRRKS